MQMSKTMESILARRFAAFNFFNVQGFPNPVPTMDVWRDYIPWFRESKEDNPSDHLIRFHQYMVQLNIQHEAVHVFTRARCMRMVFFSSCC